MDTFPIMSMQRGADVIVKTPDGVVQGRVQGWTNTPGEDFAVQVKLPGGAYEWFYVRDGAEFYH